MVFSENITHNALQRTVQLCSGTVKQNSIIPANSPSATRIRDRHGWHRTTVRSLYHFTGLSSSSTVHFKTCLVTTLQHNFLPTLWGLQCVAQFFSILWPCTNV